MIMDMEVPTNMRINRLCRAFVISLVSLALWSAANPAKAEMPPDVRGLYLGQEPPTTVPRVFAPGFVSTGHFEFSGVFSPDLNQFIFVRRGGEQSNNTIMTTQMENEVWSRPEVLELRGEPTFSPDGQT